MTKKKIYVVSYNDQSWPFDKEFASIEEAKASGPELCGIEPGEPLYVGEKKAFVLQPIDSDTVIDSLINQNDDELGEFSDDWLDEVGADEGLAREIEQKMKQICELIMKKHPPKFFLVENIVEV